MAIRPEITIKSAEAEQALKGLKARAEDIRPLMLAIGEILIDSTKRRFVEGRGPDGQPWAPNTETTLLRYLGRYKTSFSSRTGKLTKAGAGRAAGKKPLLGETKSLSRTINKRLDGNVLKIGSPMEYAATQQFGAKKGQFGQFSIVRTRQVVSVPWGNIPARPFLGLSGDDRRSILELVREHLVP